MKSSLHTKQRIQTALEQRILATVKPGAQARNQNILTSTYQPYEEPALLGDGNGNVATGIGREVYIRLISTGQLTTAINYIAPIQDNLLVWVGTTQTLPGVLQVLRLSNVYQDVAEAVSVPTHAETHRYPGKDTIWVEMAQITQLLVLPHETDAYHVRVYGGVFQKQDGSFYVLANDDVDLSSYALTTGAKYILLQYNDTGTISVLEGTLRDEVGLLTVADIPTPTAHPLIIIRVYAGQTTFRRDGVIDDFIDIRVSNGGQYVLRSGLSEWDEQASDPSTPSSSKWKLYFKSDGLYYIDDAGSATGPLGVGGGGGSGTPGGSDTYIQFNDAATFGGVSGFRFNKSLHQVALGNVLSYYWTLGNNGILVAGEGTSPAYYVESYGASIAPFLAFVAGEGTRSSPSAVSANKVLGRVRARGWYSPSSVSETQAEIRVTAEENWGTTARGTVWRIYTTPLGSTTMGSSFAIHPNRVELPSGNTYNINGTPHTHKGLFVPVTPVFMVDHLGTTWNAYAAPVGTYNFNLQDANHNLPAGISAVKVKITAGWTTASNASWVGIREKGGSQNALQARALTNGGYFDTQGDSIVGTDDDISAVVNNAAPIGVYLTLVGYYT